MFCVNVLNNTNLVFTLFYFNHILTFGMFGRFSLEPRTGRCDEGCRREVHIPQGELTVTCDRCKSTRAEQLKIKKLTKDVLRGVRGHDVYRGSGIYGSKRYALRSRVHHIWASKMKPKRRTTMRLRPFSHPAHIMSKYRTFISSRNGGPRLVAPRISLVLRQ